MSAPHQPTAREKLTPQQERFCELYVSTGRNGTQAAEIAGYGSPAVKASKLLKLDKIQQRIAELVVPVVAKAIEEVGKKAAEVESREAAVTVREEAVAEQESIEAMRERIQLAMVNSLCGMAFTTMGDLASWTEEGLQFTPSTELTPEALEAIEMLESHVNEGESPDGKLLFRNANLKIKRHNRIAAMKELRSLLSIGPQRIGGKDAREKDAGPAVLVVVAGGPTGLQLAAYPPQLLAAGSAGGSEPVAIVAPPAPVARGTPAPAIPHGVTARGAAQEGDAKPLRPWNPRPRSRAVVSRPTGQ